MPSREAEKMVAKMMLEKVGILIDIANNGLEGVEAVYKNEYDIVLLDIRMPGLSGLEVAQKIRVNCRVVFITAFDQYAIEAFENEAVDYLLKPVTDKRLAKTISTFSFTCYR